MRHRSRTKQRQRRAKAKRPNRLGWMLICSVIGTYLLAANGLLPSPAFITKTLGIAAGERFMCQSGSCGCATAHECWTNCCCFTLEQRIAWAQAENVEIPTYIKVPKSVAMVDDTPEPHCPLCVDSPEPDASPQQQSPTQTFAQQDSNPDAPGLPTLSALACKGMSSMLAMAPPITWLASAGSLIPNTPIADVQELPQPIRVSRTLDTECPPPRTTSIA